jgi:phosphatidylinositol glycan class T
MRRLILLAICFVSFIYTYSYEEELHIKPVDNNERIAAYFKFTQEIDYRKNNNHLGAFPRAVQHLVDTFNVNNLKISFTQGRWSDSWGYQFEPAVGGVEVLASISQKNAPLRLWDKLTNALSGISCASINFMKSDLTSVNMEYFSGKYFPLPKGLHYDNFIQDTTFYSVLPREIVCTENMTPWKKLLPCKAQVIWPFITKIVRFNAINERNRFV